MQRIFIDNNGNEIDVLHERNESIKAKTQEAIDMFKREQRLDKSGKRRFGYRMALQIEDALLLNGRMPAEVFVNLTYEDIEYFWKNFRSLMAYYNLYFEIVANKQLLCAYMGINNREYLQLEKHKDEDIRALMQSINDSFVGMGFVASESGNADSKATKVRLGAKDVGHNVVSASEDMAINSLNTQKSEQELFRELEKITGEKISKKLLK